MAFPIKDRTEQEIFQLIQSGTKGIDGIKKAVLAGDMETAKQELFQYFQERKDEEMEKDSFIPEDERRVSDRMLLQALDLNISSLSGVRDALKEENLPKAKRELVSYFRSRKNVKGFYDYRDSAVCEVDFLSQPYMWQHYNAKISVKDYIMKAGQKLLENTYLLPHGKQLYLGENLERYPVASYEELKKMQQGFYLIFQRGYFLEILALYYQMTGDAKALAKFQEMLTQFFRTFHLIIEEKDPESTWFQYSQNRETLNVGWLLLTFINLLNTSIVYACDENLIFEMIKRIWFLGIQFSRFENTSFQSHNIYFFTRAIVPYVISKLMPEFTAFKAMEKVGKKKVLEYIKFNFSEAGSYTEHSIGYWLGATVGEMLSKVLLTAKNEQDHFFDNESCRKIDKMFDMAALIAPPGEYYDVIGDQGGVRVETYLRMGMDLFDNQACKEVLDAREGKNISLKRYCCNPDAGFIAARDSYRRDANYMILSCREKSNGSGHDHLDMTSIDISIRGKQMFAETYAGALYKNFVLGKAPRGFLYNMTSHNCVLVHSRPIVEDSFFEAGWLVLKPQTEVSRVNAYKNHFQFHTSHTGYCFCRVNREVQFMDNIGIAVRDSVSEGIKNDRPHVQRWFLADGVTYKKMDDNVYLFENGEVRLLCLWEGRNLNFHIYKPEFLVPTIGGPEELNDVFDVEFSIREQKKPEDREPHAGVIMVDISDYPADKTEELIQQMKGLKAGDSKLYQEITAILRKNGRRKV